MNTKQTPPNEQDGMDGKSPSTAKLEPLSDECRYLLALDISRVLRWEEKRMGSISAGTLRKVMAELKGSNVELTGAEKAQLLERPR